MEKKYKHTLMYYLKMTSVGLNVQCASSSDAEEILKFETFKIQVASETDNNRK